VQNAIAIAMTTPLGTGGARFRIGGAPAPTDTVYLGVFRRSVFARVGLFDEAMERNQDYELNHRIRKTGGVVYFHPELTVDYTPRATFGELARQYRQYGDWKRRMLRHHPESLRARQLAPPLFVLGAGASAVLALTPWRAVSATYFGVYGAAVLGTALFEWVRRRESVALLCPVALVTMHVSWGVGFLFSDGVRPDPVVPGLGS
jgi:hypothetical protein